MESIDRILAQRGEQYGDFAEQAIISQSLKLVIRNGIGTKHMRDFQREAIEMILHKVARIANGNPDYRDSWDDIAGYAKLVSDRLALARSRSS